MLLKQEREKKRCKNKTNKTSQLLAHRSQGVHGPRAATSASAEETRAGRPPPRAGTHRTCRGPGVRVPVGTRVCPGCELESS